MFRPRNIYFAGTALLTAAVAIEGGTTAALGVSGFGLMFYAFCAAVAGDDADI